MKKCKNPEVTIMSTCPGSKNCNNFLAKVLEIFGKERASTKGQIEETIAVFGSCEGGTEEVDLTENR